MDRTEPERLSYSLDEACRTIGLSRATLYRLNAEGKLRFVKVSRRTIVPAADLRKLAEEGA